MNVPQMILSQVMGGLDPVQVLQKSGMMNPQMMTAMNILQGKSQQQLQEIATNMCKERGTTPADVARSLGIQIK